MHHLFRVLATGTLVFLLIGCSAESADNTANSTDISKASAPESTAEVRKSTSRTKPAAEPSARVEAPKPKKMTIPVGTELSVILIDSIRTDRNAPGDVFLTSLASPLISIDGRVAFD